MVIPYQVSIVHTTDCITKPSFLPSTQAMEALAIVILWIAEGNEIRKRRRQALLDHFCANHPRMKMVDMTVMKTRIMSFVKALPSFTVEAYLLRVERNIDKRMDFSPTLKLVFKSRVRYTVYCDDWPYQIVRLIQLYPELLPRFPILHIL